MAERILVVEDDEFLARLLKIELEAAGYDVRTASDGEQALVTAVERCPDLVLADLMMPHMDGLELTRRLRSDPRTEGVSIIMLTARGMAADKLEGLTAGADDYIVKPFEHSELIARVGGVLRRAKVNKSESPLTGLPGNIRIEDEIQARIDRDEDFALLYLDLDNFKAYSDHYGFVRGDETLRSTGHLIRNAALELGAATTFVGHIGGDDYVVVTPPEHAEPIAEEIIRRFDAAVPGFYDDEDARRGWVEGEDRQGNRTMFPLLSISIGIATTAGRRFRHRAEPVAIATELKNFAKRREGSTIAMDRRSERP